MSRSIALSIDVDDLVLALADFYRWPRREVPVAFRSTLRQVLAILAEHGAQSTLFVPGYLLKACPDALDDALAQGHEIACHGMRHVPL